MAQRRKKKGGNMGKVALVVLVILLAVGGFAAYKVFGPNTDGFRKGEYLYIPTGATYGQVQNVLDREGFVKDINSFAFLAKKAQYPDKVKPGKYHIKKKG